MELTQEILQELIDYDPDTGIARWKHRGRKWFSRDADYKTWNNKFEGKVIDRKHNQGYVTIGLFSKNYLLHRIIFIYMTGSLPHKVDHINHIRHDNRWINLRDVSDSENSKNMSIACNNTTGVTGVYLHKASGKWHPKIKINGEQVHLGLFENFDDAVDARKEAEIKYGFHENHGRDLQ